MVGLTFAIGDDVRDIRDDLRERLDGLGKRREAAKAAYDSEIKSITEEEVLIRGLLLVEQRRLGVAQDTPKATPIPLADYFLMLMNGGPRTKEELRENAQQSGYFQGEESPARVTHATLMNILRAGRAREVSEGLYVKT